MSKKFSSNSSKDETKEILQIHTLEKFKDYIQTWKVSISGSVY